MGVRIRSSLPRGVPSKNARRDGVDVDAVAGPFHREAAREREHRRFRSGVGCHFIQSHVRIQRRNVDDATAAARSQRLVESLAGAQRTGEIGVYDAVPLVFGKIFGRRAFDAARYVQQHIDSAEGGHHGVSERIYGGAVGDVGCMHQRVAALRLNQRGDFFDMGLSAPRRNDIRAGLRQAKSHALANPGSSPHYDGDAAGEVGKVFRHPNGAG
jgi:hypothetical protein